MRTRGELDQSSVGGHDLLCCIEARGSLAAESLLWGPLSIMPTMMSSLEVVHYFTSMAMYNIELLFKLVTVSGLSMWNLI